MLGNRENVLLFLNVLVALQPTIEAISDSKLSWHRDEDANGDRDSRRNHQKPCAPSFWQYYQIVRLFVIVPRTYCTVATSNRAFRLLLSKPECDTPVALPLRVPLSFFTLFVAHRSPETGVPSIAATVIELLEEPKDCRGAREHDVDDVTATEIGTIIGLVNLATPSSVDISGSDDGAGRDRALANAPSVLRHPSDIQRMSIRPRLHDASSEVFHSATGTGREGSKEDPAYHLP